MGAMSSVSPRLVIAGGSGFLGLSLAAWMAARGWGVTVLSRHAPRMGGAWDHLEWRPGELGPWVERLDGAAALVNLAGRTVDCVKTPDHCDEILRSRVESTRTLGLAVARCASPPPVWVQMSTAHIYGDPPEAVIDEGSAFGYGLAPTVGRAWEEAFAEGVLASQRGVVLRTTFVLGRSGGALPRLAKLARWGFGGRSGHGRQGISWIHEHDMNRVFERAITDDSTRGPYIATAPNPVSNAEFMRELRRGLGWPWGLPAPAPLVRLGAPLVMRTDPELALFGRFCVPRRLTEEGFEFSFPGLREAMADLCGGKT